MNVTCSLWEENDDNHSSQIALAMVKAGNLYSNNCAYNSFLGAAEPPTLSLATVEAEFFGDLRDIELQPYYIEQSKNGSYFGFVLQ